MKIKKLLLVLLAVLLVFSLFGCGKKEPVEDVEPQDTAEQLDENIKNDISGTYELSNEEIAKYYEYGYLDAKGTIMQSIQSLKSKAKACAEKLGLTYSDAQAFNLFAYGTAIEQTKKTIRWGTLRKEGAPRRLLYLRLISFRKRCNPCGYAVFSLLRSVRCCWKASSISSGVSSWRMPTPL